MLYILVASVLSINMVVMDSIAIPHAMEVPTAVVAVYILNTLYMVYYGP